MKIQPTFSTLFIDLDDTLYASSCGVWDAIKDRMQTFMHEHLGIPLEEVQPMRVQLFQQYGTTLRGLQLTREIDELAFLAFVHDVPLDCLLSPDPALRKILQAYPQRKFIFTNADRHHAMRVIHHLQLDGCFDGIIDILDIAPYCKPMSEAFQIAMRLAGVTHPTDCMFIDDSPRNLAAARDLGIATVRVGSPSTNGAAATDHLTIERLAYLPSILHPS